MPSSRGGSSKSLRNCPFSLLNSAWSDGHTVSSPPFAGRRSFPLLKGTKERIGVFKAQQKGGFVQLHSPLFQIMVGEFAARLFNELLKGNACVSQATLERACAQAEFLSDISQYRPLPSQRTPEGVLHLLAYIHARGLGFKFGIQVGSDYGHQFFVVSQEGEVEITAAKYQRVAVGP